MFLCSRCCKSSLLKSCVIYVKLLPSMLNSPSKISGESSGLEGTEDFPTENKAIVLLILHKSFQRNGVPELQFCGGVMAGAPLLLSKDSSGKAKP